MDKFLTRNVFCHIIFSSSLSMLTSLVYATDSTSITRSNATPQPLCVTNTTATGMPVIADQTHLYTPFYALATPQYGGVLCPGLYSFSAVCFVFTTTGCGGHSCGGWNSGQLNIGPTQKSWVTGHDGCSTGDNGLCENQWNVAVSFNRFTAYASELTNTSLMNITWPATPGASNGIESGGFHMCIIHAVKQ